MKCLIPKLYKFMCSVHFTPAYHGFMNHIMSKLGNLCMQLSGHKNYIDARNSNHYVTIAPTIRSKDPFVSYLDWPSFLKVANNSSSRSCRACILDTSDVQGSSQLVVLKIYLFPKTKIEIEPIIYKTTWNQFKKLGSIHFIRLLMFDGLE